MHRAADDSPVKQSFIDSLFKKYTDPAAGGATVLVAQNGSVFVDHGFGIPAQAKYMHTTTVPQFAIGDIGEVFKALCAQLPEGRGGRGGVAQAAVDTTGRGGRGAAANNNTPFQNCVARQISTPIGMHKTSATADGGVLSNVDELYRLALGLENPRTYSRDTTRADANGQHSVDYARGWQADTYRGAARLAAFGASGGKKSAFVRYPDKRATIIILTNDDAADVKAIADRISDRLLASSK
jgi:hypothetical protein